MGSFGTAEQSELIVAPDGSIPAEQITRLGIRPGAHLRVVVAASGDAPLTLAGALPEFPDLSWEDFEAASALAVGRPCRLVKVVADSHAIVWYVAGSDRLSERAAQTMHDAEESHGIVVSVATLVDLWYVTQTTRAVTIGDLDALRRVIDRTSALAIVPIDSHVADACTAIPRAVLGDPWDRFIVATAKVLDVPLVTRDGAIRKAALVPTIW